VGAHGAGLRCSPLFLTLQGELDALRAQLQRDLDGRLGRMAQASRVRHLHVRRYPGKASSPGVSRVSPLLLAGDGGTLAGAELGVAEVTLAIGAEPAFG